MNQYILFILLSTTCFVQFIIFYKNRQLKNVEEHLDNIIDKITNLLTLETERKKVSLKILNKVDSVFIALALLNYPNRE